mgnify:CR=1 FL=1
MSRGVGSREQSSDPGVLKTTFGERVHGSLRATSQPHADTSRQRISYESSAVKVYDGD